MKRLRMVISLVLAIIIVVMSTTCVFASSLVYTNVRNVNGFSVSYKLSVINSRTGKAELYCDGTTYQNPKPTFIYASIKLQVYDSDGVLHIMSKKEKTVDYGNVLALTQSYTTPSGTTVLIAQCNYTFMADSWMHALTLN